MALRLWLSGFNDPDGSDKSLTMTFDLIIIGGGAAGLFCAMTAGARGRKVLLLEHSPAVGRKILISGGGRCNFTNINARPENYICRNPNFHKSALARFSPLDFVDLVNRHRIEHYEKKLGQLFCRDSARQIVDLLLAECAAANVGIRTSCQVREVSRTTHFCVETSYGRFESETLVVATGGLSIPRMGATDLGYRIASQFGLRIVPTRPALVPLTLPAGLLEQLAPLSGTSIDSTVTIGRQKFRENTLVTHHGLSGPAILQISSYWSPGQSIHIDLLPDSNANDVFEIERSGAKELKTILAQLWPARFAHAWTVMQTTSRPLRQFSPRELRSIAEMIHDWQLTPDGTEGYRKAEVTAGGVDTDELSSKTMEARHLPGLFFIGEVVDVTGHLGGYNFQWAWASGFAAGNAV